MKFYEVELWRDYVDENGKIDGGITDYSMCIKGLRKPSVVEAELFCAKDIEALGYKGVTRVTEISKRDAYEEFEMENKENYPVFGEGDVYHYSLVGYDKDNDLYEVLYSSTNYDELFEKTSVLIELCEKDKLFSSEGEPFDWLEILDSNNYDVVYWTSYEKYEKKEEEKERNIMTREFYEVYAMYPDAPSQRVAGYSKETALQVINDETVKAHMKSHHLIMTDGRTGEIVAESKLNKNSLQKIVDNKVDEIIIDYCKQQCIMTGDISPQEQLYLNTIKDSLVNCIYEICDKNRKSFSSENRILTNFLIIGQKYDFRTEFTKYGACLYARDTDGEYSPWIKYNMKEDTFSIIGNTDQCNFWFYDTRPDLTPDKLIEFVKDLNWALEPDEPILLKTLIDPEDWQEIAGVRDAYEDTRYINN